MRELNEDEKELIEKSLLRLQDEADELVFNLDYNRDLKSKEKYLREFDDKWRKSLRVRKDREDNKMLLEIQKLIDEKDNTIDVLNKQINEGVEDITPSSVQ